MTDVTNTVERIEAANPVTSPLRLPTGSLSPAELLTRIDDRSNTMTTTQQPVRPTGIGEPPGPGRGALIAATVAVVVVIIIGLTTLNVLRGDQSRVTIEPAPTTTLGPPATPLDVADAFVDARNRRAADDMASFFAAQATIDGDLTRGVAGYASVVEFERVTGWHFTLGTCSESAAAIPQTVRLQCPFTYENDWSRALGLGSLGSIRTAFTFTITDGQIVRLAMVLDIGEVNLQESRPNYRAVNDPFVDWLEDAHPDDMWAIFDQNGCFPGGVCPPLLTPEALDLWERYSAEFVEFVSNN